MHNISHPPCIFKVNVRNFVIYEVVGCPAASKEESWNVRNCQMKSSIKFHVGGGAGAGVGADGEMRVKRERTAFLYLGDNNPVLLSFSS